MATRICYQENRNDCGPACLKMVCDYYGIRLPIEDLREKCELTSAQGVSVADICAAAESIGLESCPTRISFEELKKYLVSPVILHWENRHFIVATKIRGDSIHCIDPAIGKVRYTQEELLAGWGNGGDKGVAIIFRLPDDFKIPEKGREKRTALLLISESLSSNSRPLLLLLLLAAVSAGISYLLPSLTQSVVDKGIGNKDVSLITILIAGQFALMLSATAATIFQSKVMLGISNRIRLTMNNSVIQKLARLPLSYFASHQAGDTFRRISDISRIEQFISNSFIQIALSIVNLCVYGYLLFNYQHLFLAVFALCFVLYSIWTLTFIERRKKLDYNLFSKESERYSGIMQYIRGIRDIKFNSMDGEEATKIDQMLSEINDLNKDTLKNSNTEQAGASIILSGTSAAVLFISAVLTAKGEITFGTMMAIQYISGQLISPIRGTGGFIQIIQNALLSANRISGVLNLKEEPSGVLLFDGTHAPDIEIEDVHFHYRRDGKDVLNGIDFKACSGTSTVIVGESGCGKTTVLKLITKEISPQKGHVLVNGYQIDDYNLQSLRSTVGFISPDSFVFQNSIKENISLSENTDLERVKNAARLACLDEFVQSLPNGYDTIIGNEGYELSRGQIQRLIIARCIYKEPLIVLLDEGTSALDPKTEAAVLDNLKVFLKGKTAIIITHDIDAYRWADKFYRMDNDGCLKEL